MWHYFDGKSLIYSSAQFTDKPKFNQTKTVITLNEGESKIVNIDLIANPRIYGLVCQKIDNNNKTRELSLERLKVVRMSLHIIKVSRKDSGRYLCSASNVIGRSTTWINLNVTCKYSISVFII